METLKLLTLLTLVIGSVRGDYDFESSEKLAKFACDVVDELTREQPETKTITIIDWTVALQSPDYIMRCMTRDVAFVRFDPEKPYQNSFVNPSLIILQCDQMNVALFERWVDESHASPIFDHNAKFLMLAVRINANGWKFVFQHMTNERGLSNFAAVYVENGEVNPIIFDSQLGTLENQKEKLKDGESILKVLYPDKFSGQVITVLSYEEKLRVEITEDRKVLTKYEDFLNIVSKKMNANIEHDILSVRKDYDSTSALKLFKKVFEEKSEGRKFSLTFNTHTTSMDSAQKFITYEQSSYCILVPYSKERTFGVKFLMKAFDPFIWGALALTLIIAAIFWKIVSLIFASHSWGRFLFGVYGYLLGQGVEIRSRGIALKLLLQIIIFMMIILNNSYRGMMTSFLMNSSNVRLESLDDILKSDHVLLVGGYAELMLNSHESYQTAKKQGKVNTSGAVMLTNFSYFYDRNFAVMLPCEKAEFDLGKSGEASPFYYLLNEKFFSTLLKLDASFCNPYINRIQQIMDECFAAGLHQAWETFYEFDQKVEQQSIESRIDRKQLPLKSIKDVFILLLSCLFVSFITFIIEVLLKILLRRLRQNQVSDLIRNATF